ncbi:MAG: hypothetical protein DI603_15200 [Roseateles depolymerans]|uniref:Uncharacterized protein n=1 Tax=Roseateles depolymerans TaxID=76731 RepID=A0A2W5DI38_9BURK|nr:MAG: hypothetical protein DI603_15200 [Roseateles depolymerans]
MSKSSQRRGRREAGLTVNPVATAMAVSRMRSHMRTVGIALFLTDDGAEARGLVSHLAWIIGMGAEISANRLPGSDVAKRQHIVLRNLVHIATEGCAWRASLAEAIWAAALEANGLLMKYPTTGLAVQAGADQLADSIKAGSVRMADVAGAEIYGAAAPAELCA